MLHEKSKNIIKCHYFNNNVHCPYELVGCMFSHTISKICKDKKECKRNYVNSDILK